MKAVRGRFRDDLVKALESQYRWCGAYQRACREQGYLLKDIIRLVEDDELISLPSIGSDSWKKSNAFFRHLSNPNVAGAWLVSSSTSGDPSYRWCTDNDLRHIMDSYQEAFAKVPFADVGLIFSPPLSFLEKASERFKIGRDDAELYARYPFRAALKTFEKPHFLYRPDNPKARNKRVEGKENSHRELKLERKLMKELLQSAGENDLTVVLGPSVLFLYPVMSNLLEGGEYDLGEKIYVSTGGGGWDGRKALQHGENVGKATYVDVLVSRLGISRPEKQIIDTYGTTENGKAQSGFYNNKLKDFVFDAGQRVKMFLIDPSSKEPVGRGERGVPRFISPYGFEGSAGVVIDQEDDVMTAVSAHKDKSVKKYTNVSKVSKLGGSDAGAWDGCPYDWAEMITKRYLEPSS